MLNTIKGDVKTYDADVKRVYLYCDCGLLQDIANVGPDLCAIGLEAETYVATYGSTIACTAPWTEKPLQRMVIWKQGDDHVQ